MVFVPLWYNYCMTNIGDIMRGKELGKKGRHRYIYRPCQKCNKPRWVMAYQYSIGESRLCKHCSDQANIRTAIKYIKPRPYMARRWVTTDGYVTVNLPRGHRFVEMTTGEGRVILEHRLVMAYKLDRFLMPHEVVHHLNGIRSDNRPDNLVVTDKSNHPRHTLIKLLQEHIRELECTKGSE